MNGSDRRKGRTGWRLWSLVLAGLLVAVAGCQRAGIEPPPPAPAPPPTDEVSETVIEVERDRPTLPAQQLRGGVLPVPHVDVTGVDPILHARIGQDPHLRERSAFWATFWTTRSRDHFERYLDRMGAWEAFVDGELAARGLPASLRYLPIVESGYHHSIRSRAGATGLWQLMAPTARDLGLTVDGIVDERRDPVASTRAALEYLGLLHDQFGSWYLALSAYNAGPGRIARILQRHAPDPAMPGDERFLRARAHFPAETREFVPRFFAAAALASDPGRHDLPLVDPSRRVRFDEVVVPDATSLDVVARAAGVDEEEIIRLNPQYHRGFTPPGSERVVRVPEGRGRAFEVAYAEIPASERVSFMEHRVARGETLSHIARRYGVSVAELQGANGNLDPRRLQVGQDLIVPIGGAPVGSGASQVAASGTTESPPDVHVVAAGESLWAIGRRYGLGVSELRRKNGLSNTSRIQPGQELSVGNGGVRTHSVQPGDTWGGVAQRYGVSTSALARANGRTTGDVIRVGEEIRIP